MFKIALLDDYQHLARRYADWSGVESWAEVTAFDRHLGTVAEAAETLAPFDAVCHIRERMAMPRELIEQLPRLKFIGVSGRYHRTLDIEAALERGITVSHTSSSKSGHGTSELAWSLIHALARHIPYEAGKMRHGGWQDSVGIQLWRRTLGLVGLGKQGSLMVPVAKAFDMDVIAWSQNLTEEAASAVGARRVEKDELFRRSDIVSIHVVLGERTRGLVGAPELALMKQGALLVNTARGPIVDEGALLEALDQGRIRAALDVYDVEPLPDDHPLRRAPNAILTPHLGYTVEEFFEVAYQDTVENLIAFHEGAPLRLVTAENNFSSPPR
jgi:D-3-phosphoglycerate dehydrogenase